MATVVLELSWDELHQPQLGPCREAAPHRSSPNVQGLGTGLEPSSHLLQVRRVPELPGLAQELLGKSSVVPRKKHSLGWDWKRRSPTVNPALLTNSAIQGQDRSMDSMFYLPFNKQPKQR